MDQDALDEKSRFAGKVWLKLENNFTHREVESDWTAFKIQVMASKRQCYGSYPRTCLMTPKNSRTSRPCS